MNTLTERPAWACVLHQPPATIRQWTPADTGHYTCWACCDSLRQRLADIRRRYLELNPARTPHPGDHTPGAPGFGSRSPASEHVITMTDPRSSAQAHVWIGSDRRVHREDEHPPLSVYNVLYTWAVDIGEQRGYRHHPDTDVFGLCVWLASQLDWITRQNNVVTDFAADLRRLEGQLKPVTGDRRIPIGPCSSCRAVLYAPLHGATVQCRGCGTRWPYNTWITLGDILNPDLIQTDG